jgi:prepilin-type N-terminal cleavage/methylation domain-containing protein
MINKWKPISLRHSDQESKSNNAFTLAEVLITLLIIGVVASLVIPNLINDTQEAELHTAWKKSYAEMASAFNKAKMDNGGTLQGACADNDNNCMRNLVSPYLSFTKSCDNLNTNGPNQCIYDTSTILKRYSGSIGGYNWNASALMLNNGAIVIFSYTDKVCDLSICDSNIQVCGWYMVDINGFKGPNTIGKDFYHGWITKDGTLPVGALDQNNSVAFRYNSSSCDKLNLSAHGWGCSAKFLYQ